MNDVLMSAVRDALVNLILALIVVAIPAIAFPVIAYLRKKLSARQLAIALEIGRIVVAAAEQVGAKAGFDGKDKLLSALNQARDLAAKQGITLTDDQLQTIIEAAVLELKKAGTALVTPEIVAGNIDLTGAVPAPTPLDSVRISSPDPRNI